MKRLLLMFFVVGVTVSSWAQLTDKQVATLQHGDETRVFYGIDALKRAYEAADSLDVITLSSGKFNVPEAIRKSVAIYGAGFEEDSVTGTKRTELNVSLIIAPHDGIHLEGLYINGGIDMSGTVRNLSIVKCRCQVILFRGSCEDCEIRQCVVDMNIANSGYKKVAKNLLISNCYILGTASISHSKLSFSAESTILIDHCVLRHKGITEPYTFTNNISYFAFPNGYTGSHNVFVDVNNRVTGDDGPWLSLHGQEFFAAEGNDYYAEDKDFRLKFPERYVGTDGTEIGLHGGKYGWSKIPGLPRIVESEVLTDELSQGKLKVHVKAEAAK